MIRTGIELVRKHANRSIKKKKNQFTMLEAAAVLVDW